MMNEWMLKVLQDLTVHRKLFDITPELPDCQCVTGIGVFHAATNKSRVALRPPHPFLLAVRMHQAFCWKHTPKGKSVFNIDNNEPENKYKVENGDVL